VSHNAGTFNLGTHNIGRGGKRALARHFAEMLLAMFAGMVVLGAWRSLPSPPRAAACPISRAAFESR
jgi:hypothetical protein